MYSNFYPIRYRYTLAVEGIKMRSFDFASRQAANNKMYEIVGHYGLHLKKVYDDKHFKTYIFDNGVRIHINRD